VATSSALDIALAYHRAWTSGDIDTAATYLADDIVFGIPAGTLTSAEDVRGFMEPFAARLISSTLLTAHGDGEEAALVYDTRNPAVASAPAAEYYRVREGRIISGRIIFDRLPFAIARGDVTPSRAETGVASPARPFACAGLLGLDVLRAG
jgi:ketosteroid isomerase-like protein